MSSESILSVVCMGVFGVAVFGGCSEGPSVRVSSESDAIPVVKGEPVGASFDKASDRKSVV